MKKSSLIPVLLGSDLNAYSVAVAFHRAFGVSSFSFGRRRLGRVAFSGIVRHASFAGDERRLLAALISFGKKRRGTRLVLVPCAARYVGFINENRAALAELYRFVLPSAELLALFDAPAELFRALSESGVATPSCLLAAEPREAEAALASLCAPVVLCPASLSEYGRVEFPHRRREYRVEAGSAAVLVSHIRSYGYSGGFVLREAPAGRRFVYSAFVPRSGEISGAFAELAVRRGRAHPVAVELAPRKALCERINAFLRRIGFVGAVGFELSECGGKYQVVSAEPLQSRLVGADMAVAIVRELFGEDPPSSRRVKKNKEASRRRAFSSIFCLPDVLRAPWRLAHLAIQSFARREF